MSFLLDTNVISELRKPAARADSHVRAWAASQPSRDLYLSVITVLEIEIGIARLARRDSIRAERIQSWLDNDVFASFSGRILAVDLPVARHAARFHVPDPSPERIALIAATASVHGLTVATRNVKDFQPFDVAVVDPWNFETAR